ncbi:hypothetical protein [Actinacidiphila acididurans]|uniref:Uncharacterized protein n=1 Tax=Actinacidiphila acididurans TaxID=2784346 RepID=A0ABS2TQM0_9ACTN|nr:hypothetical protein [Actinacidiphila acididurans]MBM9505306.1 hypothetical protein [Actinacidiphila acididurans]
MNTTPHRALLLAARRVRLLAILAGWAWLLGIHPPVIVRLVLVGVFAVALVLDLAADAGMRPGPVQLTGWGRPGGDER